MSLPSPTPLPPAAPLPRLSRLPGRGQAGLNGGAPLKSASVLGPIGRRRSCGMLTMDRRAKVPTTTSASPPCLSIDRPTAAAHSSPSRAAGGADVGGGGAGGGEGGGVDDMGIDESLQQTDPELCVEPAAAPSLCDAPLCSCCGPASKSEGGAAR